MPCHVFLHGAILLMLVIPVCTFDFVFMPVKALSGALFVFGKCNCGLLI